MAEILHAPVSHTSLINPAISFPLWPKA